MGKGYFISRRNLTASERQIINRLEEGLPPFGKLSDFNTTRQMRFRANALLSLCDQGFLELHNGNYVLTADALKTIPDPREYSEAEKQLILDHYASFETTSLLAERLCRTEKAIHQFAVRIGAPLRQNKGKPGTCRKFDGKAPRGRVANQTESR